MKKLISVLLAVLMAFSVMPITAMAEDIIVNSEEIFEIEPTGVDYSAFDSIVILVEALSTKEYTKESIENVKSKVVSRESLKTQEDVNNAVIEIATAYAELEKNSFKVSFIILDSNEEQTTKTFTYTYGETASLSVDNGETPYKWIVTNAFGDKVIGSSENELSLVIEGACKVVACTDVEPEEKEQLRQINFLSFNGRVINIVYTNDVYDIEMPEAPALPFYYFSEWVKLNDNTYQARYLSDTICDGNHHRFTTMIAKPTCTNYGYVIFQCSCGEAYYTDYSKPIGHNYDENTHYCKNGCGTQAPMDDEASPEESSPTEPTSPTEPAQDEEKDYGFDEEGYNNIVVAP